MAGLGHIFARNLGGNIARVAKSKIYEVMVMDVFSGSKGRISVLFLGEALMAV